MSCSSLSFVTLLESADPPEITWLSKNRLSWKARFFVDDIRIIVFFREYQGDIIWDLVFFQADDENKFLLRSKDVNFVQLTRIFLGIQEALFQFFDEKRDVVVVRIDPMAVGSERLEKVRSRTGSVDSGFDENKFYAYQQLFKYSELSRSGYEMVNRRGVLYVIRPKMGEFEKDVEYTMSRIFGHSTF